MNIKETFKPIEGYTSYEVSNLGRVKGYISGKILKNIANKHKNGKTNHAQVNLYYAPKKHNGKIVARLVAEAFFEDFTNDCNVLHIDGDKMNCNAYNLFLTRSARMTSSVQSGIDTVYVGAHLNRGTGKTKPWRSAYMKDGKTIRIGEFKDQLKAGMAYLDEIKKIDIECYNDLIRFYKRKDFHIAKRHRNYC